MEKDECMALWHRLVRSRVGHDGGISASSYLRRFMDTGRCDQFGDLSDCRVDIKAQLDPGGSFNRIMNNTETQTDEWTAHIAVWGHSYWHSRLVGLLKQNEAKK